MDELNNLRLIEFEKKKKEQYKLCKISFLLFTEAIMWISCNPMLNTSASK